jgi:UDP-2-acetamido-2,6-beta-L-arabino-hexul-4-ose reductase
MEAKVRRIGITGASGLIGWHLACAIKAVGRDEIRLAGRSEFSDPARLDDFVAGCDVIVHLAGLNRGDASEVEETNVWLADQLAAAVERSGSGPMVIFANSTHRDLNTPYGRSKRRAAALFEKSSQRNSFPFVDMVLPNVFGELGRPFANSAVSTFCHQLANDEVPRIIEDREVELVHTQDVAERILTGTETPNSRVMRIRGHDIKVSDLLQRLRDLAAEYGGAMLPELPTRFDRQLFNTLRSYRFLSHPSEPLHLHEDERGAFVELAKRRGDGQVSYSWTHPGVTRGNHFHLEKIERFVVLEGQADIKVRKLFSEDVLTVAVDGRQPCAVDMPTLHTHSITNTGSGVLLTMFWVDEIFDPARPDTFVEPVMS